MKKLLLVALFASSAFAATAASAWDRHDRYPRPQPPVYNRIETVLGRASGGTTHGDRGAACDRAYSRAHDEAYSQCSYRRGYVVDTRYGNCDCRRKPGSRDDYNCEATVYVGCDVGRGYNGGGNGGWGRGDGRGGWGRRY